jgi:WD40 repeat protein
MDRSIRCWALSSGECVGVLNASNEGHTEAVTCLELINVEGQDYVASGSVDTHLKLWNTSGSKMYSESEGVCITCLKASKDTFGIARIFHNTTALLMFNF